MPPFRTLVVSDTHLSVALPADEPGSAHRKPSSFFDDALAHLIDQAIVRSRGARLEVVCNGDFFDLDAPPSVAQGGTLPEPVSHVEDAAAVVMATILRDHPRVVRALGRVLATGHCVVFVAGNHDAHLAFDAVREVVAVALVAAASLYGSRAASELHAGVTFRRLYHRTPDGFHVEHGHQYDPLCALGVPFAYARQDGAVRIDDTIGSVASYYGEALLRGDNPHGLNPLELRAADLLRDAWGCVAPGRVAPAWYVAGAARMLQQLALVSPATPSDALVAFEDAVSREMGASVAKTIQHAGLFASPARVAWLLDSAHLNEPGAQLDRRVRAATAGLQQLYDARGVVTGHTHRPYGAWRDGRWYGNSGSWVTRDDGTVRGSYVWIRTDGGVTQALSRTLDGGPFP